MLWYRLFLEEGHHQGASVSDSPCWKSTLRDCLNTEKTVKYNWKVNSLCKPVCSPFLIFLICNFFSLAIPTYSELPDKITKYEKKEKCKNSVNKVRIMRQEMSFWHFFPPSEFQNICSLRSVTSFLASVRKKKQKTRKIIMTPPPPPSLTLI